LPINKEEKGGSNTRPMKNVLEKYLNIKKAFEKQK
jgi:hypothetical protein